MNSNFLSILKELLLVAIAITSFFHFFKHRAAILIKKNLFLVSALTILGGLTLSQYLHSSDKMFLISLKGICLFTIFAIIFKEINIKQERLLNFLSLAFLIQIPFILYDLSFPQWTDGQVFGTFTNPTAFAYMMCFFNSIFFFQGGKRSFLLIPIPPLLYLSDSFTGQIVLVLQILAFSLFIGKGRVLLKNFTILSFSFIASSFYFKHDFHRLYNLLKGLLQPIFSGMEIQNPLKTISVSNRREQLNFFLENYDISHFSSALKYLPFDSSLLDLLWNFGLLATALLLLQLYSFSRKFLSLQGLPLVITIICFLATIRIHIFYPFLLSLIILSKLDLDVLSVTLKEEKGNQNKPQ